jgi:excisionase family DNA binding protein
LKSLRITSKLWILQDFLEKHISLTDRANISTLSHTRLLDKGVFMPVADDKQKQDKMLSTSEAGKRLGVTSKTVIRMIESGQIPGYKVNFVWKIKESDVDIYLETHKYKPGQQQDSD